MGELYKIEVMIFSDKLNSSKPFFWYLLSNTGDKWCNIAFGHESTPEKAWEAAYRFYKNYKFDMGVKGENNG